MPVENPFRESRLNESRDFRPEWDIPDLNRGVTDALARDVERLRGRRVADPAQMIAVVTGPPGYGKTHLFGRIEHLIRQQVFFAFVPSFVEATPPLEHINRHVIEALFRPGPHGVAAVDAALARLCRPAFRDYFSDLPPTLATRHDTLARRLDEDAEAVIEIVRSVKSLDPFLKLADSLVSVLPHDAAIVRALALGWAPAPWNGIARRWLQGQDLPDAERDLLGFRDVAPEPLDVLRAVPALFGYERPLMICCDQIEGITMGDSEDRINRFSSALIDLLQTVPVQIVLNCFHDTWKFLAANTMSALIMRVKKPFRLEDLSPDHAVQLIGKRLASWPGRSPDQPEVWPFDRGSIETFVRRKGPTPRGLIQTCDKEFEEWVEDDQHGLIDLNRGSDDPIDLPQLFVREWNRELEAIRQDTTRAAHNLAEDRLYAGVLEALKLAQSAQMLRDFGGVRIMEIRDGVVKAAAPKRRPGAMVRLAGKPGEDGVSLIIALTTIEASNQLSHYFTALFRASEPPHVGAVMIHPRRDIDVVGITKSKVDAQAQQGRFRLMALEDHATTFQSLECLTTLLERAMNRELVLSGITLSADDCRNLVIKTGVIDHLDLFKRIGGWKRPASVVAPTPTAAQPPAAEAKPTPTPGPTPTPPPVSPPSATSPAPNSPKPGVNMDAWSSGVLAAAVKKLNLLGQQVEPDGHEVGPTFVRLRVRPIGKTNFKAVANKAVDLRISLDLKVPPIVGSQAGCISIDVQRPERAVVPLRQALADPPAGLADLPAFPVGMDVAGQAHWLNLADPTDCHLLVAGTTGSGKSEFLRALIAGLASRLGPDRLQFLLIDPKRVTFNLSGPSPYLRAPVAYGLDEALPLIERVMAEMDRRYAILKTEKLSDVAHLPPELTPRIVVVIDEFASFLEDKQSKKAVTDLLKRIGAMARAAGIHLVLSTQRPDKDVVTPILRENLPGRIALRVASKAGSDLILGEPDAENLLGRGDLFWKRGGELLRLQSPFVAQEELERILRGPA